MDINRRSYKSLIKTLIDAYEIIDQCADGSLKTSYNYYPNINDYSDDFIKKIITLKVINEVMGLFLKQQKEYEKEINNE